MKPLFTTTTTTLATYNKPRSSDNIHKIVIPNCSFPKLLEMLAMHQGLKTNKDNPIYAAHNDYTYDAWCGD